MVVQVRGLVAGFGAGPVLRGLDLRVDEGEVVALTGVNGTGKSTLLRCLAGLHPYEAGDVRVLSGPPSDDREFWRSAGLPAVAEPRSAALTATLLTGALAAASSGTSGVRRDTAAMLRLLAVRPVALRAARTVLPAVLAALWQTGALAGLALDGAVPAGAWTAVAAAPALGAAALRMAGRGPIDHGLTPIDTPLGPLPSGLMLWALTGLDVALAGCAPAGWALAGHAVPVVAQAATAFAVLAGYVLLRRPRP